MVVNRPNKMAITNLIYLKIKKLYISLLVSNAK